MGDFIKIDRKILKWEWWSDIKTFRLFMYMLISANWKDGNFKGILIPRGSFVSSIPKLASETCLSEREVRTAIKHLKLTGELTVKTTNKFSLFTINNYCLYQDTDMQNVSQVTGKRQANDMQNVSQVTTIEEIKNKEIKNNIIPPISPSKVDTKKFIPPTVDEVREYCDERNKGVDPQAFVDYYESNGWHVGKNKMKDWKAAVRTWERNRNNNCYGNKQGKEVNTYESESSVQLW